MSPKVRHPSERSCERCGRRERWDSHEQRWRVEDEVGVAYCIHEWDINGNFVPFDNLEA
ncbi:MAG: HEWD family protein [Halobaculum sp.]|jgi:hypothetical protein